MANEEFEPIRSIEVTDQMVEAGAIQLFLSLGPSEAATSYEEAAEAVFKSMVAQCSTALLPNGAVTTGTKKARY